ncbi:DUF4260 domain-containing protein [Methylovirgula sp. 4M-Z18]|uniref:DUF4260 domain-containing protein n=1 Tax=Methylovirgula sp. 4M-Z18 TaxID=2293567 RepID=UPI000E2FC4D7|nr:DUF4260 domain-containing protein [Methylovirgula sp. 4M-Z18]RFB80129.1 DUF4260 family protein [Methylovirgula sp. 4M-Z18]
MNVDRVVSWQKFEGAIIFFAGILLFVFFHSELPWWIAPLVFLAPDLSFASYIFGPKIGAFGYNLVHVYAFGAVFMTAGMAFSLPVLSALGGLWFAHSGFDRMLGYGLKSTEGFTFTHLGLIGKSSDPRK